MLGKLIKYEYKATMRTFLPIYIALILVAAVNRLFQNGDISFGLGISSLILSGLFIALVIVTIVVVIQRFNRNLLGDEGYLMFTLPVNSRNLIFSKLIMCILWTIISILVAIIACFILVGNISDLVSILTHMGEIWEGILMNIEIGNEDVSIGRVMIMFAGCSLLGYTHCILQIYLSLAFAQLPKLSKHRGIVSFVAFFCISVIETIITNVTVQLVPESIFENSFTVTMFFMIIYAAIKCGIIYGLIKWILDKHLNLE